MTEPTYLDELAWTLANRSGRIHYYDEDYRPPCPYCDGGGTVAVCQANDIECQCPGGPDVCLECRASCRCPNCDGEGQI